MLCEKCKKRKASVFFFEGGVTRQLCQNCAAARTATAESVSPQSPPQELTVPSELTKCQLSPFSFDYLPQNEGNCATFRCKSCGSDIQDIKMRRAGCPDCVVVLSKIGVFYCGSAADRSSRLPSAFRKKQQIQKQIMELKQKISSAVAAEDFETAAKIRDKIRSLEAESV